MVPAFLFPKMPDEVREMWLDSIAEGKGWPFASVNESTKGTDWQYVFPFPLAELADFDWNLETANLSEKPLCQDSLAPITGLLQQHVMKLDAGYAHLHRTHERFWACADYIKSNNSIPAPVILLDNGNRFRVLDGYHRLAALAHIHPPDCFKLPAWVARRPQTPQVQA